MYNLKSNRTSTNNEKRKASFLKMEIENKMLTNELKPEELNLIVQRQNEKKELSEAASLVKNFVNVLKEGMKNNYEDDNNNLPKISLKKLYTKRTSAGNMFYNFNPKKTMGDYKRKSFDISINFENNNNNRLSLNEYKKKLLKKITVRNYNKNRLSLNSNEGSKIHEKKDKRQHRHSYNGNEFFNNLKPEINDSESLSEDDENVSNNIIHSPKLKSALKSCEIIKKKVGFNENNKINYIKNRLSIGSNNSNEYNNLKYMQSLGNYKTNFLNEEFRLSFENDKMFSNRSVINSNNILKLSDLKKEIKNSLIGEDIKNSKLNEGKNYLFDDIIKQNNIKIESEEEVDITFKEQRYRNLQRKGFVYDSFDDEENIIDDENNFFFINPESSFITFFDFFIAIISIYYLIYIPYFLGSNKIFCKSQNNYLEFFFDMFYLLDLILPFFIAYYNFDEILKTHFKDRCINYLTGWFFLDFIEAIPFKGIFLLFDKKCKKENFLINPYQSEYHYLLLCFRILKIFKVLSKNKFLDYISKILNNIEYFSNYLTLYSSITIFFLAIHIVSNVFIFIGNNEFPGWISEFGYSNYTYLNIYLVSIYYTITTLTTVGYGDLHCVTKSEKIFGMLMEVVGIFAYSWALTSVSNYVKVLNEKTEEYEKKKKVLEEIKITYPQLSDDLYDRISRFIKYKHDKEQLDKNIIIECLPVNLSNLLVYEMYKPIINNFIFFKSFDNVDFIVKVILNFKPIIAMKNDILIKEGDLVEDIIFVKRGKLSLELPLNKNPKLKTKTIKTQSLKNSPSMLIRNQTSTDPFKRRRSSIFNDVQTFSQVKTLINNNLKKEEENIQTFKILEIRKNEHFGDILMFLNQRSPLNLRVKSKKVELFFLNKTDAIDISTSYPSIWKKINMKSLFNYEQIKRLMNKIIKIFNSSYGLNNYNPFSELENKNTINSTLNPFELIDEEDELQSIPTLSDNYFDNDNEQLKLSETIKRIKSKKNTLNTINEIATLEEYSENNYSSNNEEEINKISEISEEEESISKSEKLNKSYSVENKSINKNKIEKNKTNNSDFTVRHKTKTFEEILEKTPFKPEDINDEIYPDETFVNSNKNNENEKEESQLKKKLYDFININNNNFNNENISICSTEISFSLNGDYENLNELSDYKYSKDHKLRNRVKNLLKEELNENISQKLSKSFSSSSNESNEEENENDNDNESNVDLKSIGSRKFRKLNIKKNHKRQSVSFFKSFNFNKKNSNVLRKTGTTKQDERNLQILNFQNRSRKSNNFIENRKTRKEIVHKSTIKSKKNLLRTISKNIERNQINLNNPDLFYSEYFHKILDKKKLQHGEYPLNKEEEELMNKLEKKSTFSRINSLTNNFTLNFSPTIRGQN